MKKKHTPKEIDDPNMEKPNMTQPAEEFISEKSIPSKSMKSGHAKSSTSPQRAHDVKPAGHQQDRAECFEPGVEG